MCVVLGLPVSAVLGHRSGVKREVVLGHAKGRNVCGAGRYSVQVTTPRDELLTLIRDLAVVRGRVTLSSGREADYYVDLRRVTLHGRGAPLVGQVLLDTLIAAGLGPDTVAAAGGLTMGADPVALALVHAAAARGMALDGFVVRKEAKAHGMQRQIEGPDIAGRRVVVVEDTSTTGSSPLTALAAARKAGAEVVAVAVIVDRATGARERIEAAGVSYHALFSLEDLGLV